MQWIYLFCRFSALLPMMPVLFLSLRMAFGILLLSVKWITKHDNNEIYLYAPELHLIFFLIVIVCHTWRTWDSVSPPSAMLRVLLSSFSPGVLASWSFDPLLDWFFLSLSFTSHVLYNFQKLKLLMPIISCWDDI